MKTNLALSVRGSLIAAAFLFAIGMIGCVNSKEGTAPEKPPEKSGSPVARNDPAGEKKDHMESDTIDGFWCEPHGLPEDECWKCNKSFCRDCEKKGDWCKEHLRPKSQCFKCDPTLIATWAKVYESKTGKQAPKPKNY